MHCEQKFPQINELFSPNSGRIFPECVWGSVSVVTVGRGVATPSLQQLDRRQSGQASRRRTFSLLRGGERNDVGHPRGAIGQRPGPTAHSHCTDSRAIRQARVDHATATLAEASLERENEHREPRTTGSTDRASAESRVQAKILPGQRRSDSPLQSVSFFFKQSTYKL